MFKNVMNGVKAFLKKQLGVKAYVVWSASKLPTADNSLTGLVEHELSPSGGSLSSEVVTDNIGDLIKAVYNETDIELSYCTSSEYEAERERLESRESIKACRLLVTKQC